MCCRPLDCIVVNKARHYNRKKGKKYHHIPPAMFLFATRGGSPHSLRTKGSSQIMHIKVDVLYDCNRRDESVTCTNGCTV